MLATASSTALLTTAASASSRVWSRRVISTVLDVRPAIVIEPE
jgi:hypothetical protein